MTYPMLNNVMVIFATIVALLIVFSPKMMQSRTWRATVTPLASIIGSGFLILGPILGRDYGIYATVVMVGLCAASYSIGAAIRFNIMEYDRVRSRQVPKSIQMLEKIASWALVIAYVISVAYYLNLFGAFAVKLTPVDSENAGRLVSSGALLFIGVFGYMRGLSAMERMEEVAVGLKLAIIVGLLVGLAAYAFELEQSTGLHVSQSHSFGLRNVAVALGLIITVQGFETSRYLGDEYTAEMRVKTMKYAQWISAIIYIVYIALVSVSFLPDQVESSETAIIDMTQIVAPLLPTLLVLAALAAQFSAAVADTSGSGGLASELSRKRIKPNVAYAILVVGAIAITWFSNIYEIISYASRAFAVYYFLQVIIALRFALNHDKRNWTQITFFILVAVFALSAAILGIPAEG